MIIMFLATYERLSPCRHNCIYRDNRGAQGNEYNCLWVHLCLGTFVSLLNNIVYDDNLVWAQSSGSNHVLAQSRLGIIVSGGIVTYGHNRVWVQAWGNPII